MSKKDSYSLDSIIEGYSIFKTLVGEDSVLYKGNWWGEFQSPWGGGQAPSESAPRTDMEGNVIRREGGHDVVTRMGEDYIIAMDGSYLLRDALSGQPVQTTKPAASWGDDSNNGFYGYQPPAASGATDFYGNSTASTGSIWGPSAEKENPNSFYGYSPETSGNNAAGFYGHTPSESGGSIWGSGGSIWGNDEKPNAWSQLWGNAPSGNPTGWWNGGNSASQPETPTIEVGRFWGGE